MAVLLVISYMLILLVANGTKIPMPWNYTGYDAFPVFFFGASPKNLESTSVMTLAAKHQIAGWGWQQNNTGLPQEELNLYNQAKAFNTFYTNTSNNIQRSTQSTFVYRTGSSANPFWKTLYNIYNDSNYRDFWVKNENGQVCTGIPTALYNYQASGPLFNFSNTTASEYYLNNVIKEIITDYPYINSVFFDMCDWIYCNYNWKTLTNCSNFDGLNDQQKYQLNMAAVNVFAKATEILNNAGIIPIYSFMTLLNDNPEKLMDNYTKCKVKEEIWIDALQNLTWIRYQELTYIHISKFLCLWKHNT